MRVLYKKLLVLLILTMVVCAPAIAGNACQGQVEAIKYLWQGVFEITIHNARGKVVSAHRCVFQSRIAPPLDYCPV